jgi:hypothetical protein
LFRGYNLFITIGNIAAILIIVFTQFIWAKTTEFFPGAANLGNILFNISMSYIVSYIFYVILVYLPEQKNKKYMENEVNKAVQLILGDFYQVNNEMEKVSGHLFNKPTTLSNVEDILRTIHPYATGFKITLINNQFVMLNWSQCLADTIEESNKKINALLVYMPFLDARLVSVLNRLNSSLYFKCQHAFSTPMNNQDLSVFAQQYHEYFKLMIELEEVKRKLFKHS